MYGRLMKEIRKKNIIIYYQAKRQNKNVMRKMLMKKISDTLFNKNLNRKLTKDEHFFGGGDAVRCLKKLICGRTCDSVEDWISL